MSDKKNFYYRQQVLEANLDEAFDAAEDAVRDLTYDTDLIARTPTSSKAEFGGIMWGFYDEVHIAGGMLLRVSEGAAYDESGRRIHVDATYEIDITNDGSTAIGAGGATSGGNSIDPGTDKERWVTIFAVFDRLVSDPRYDGYNDLVYFENTESFHFEVVAGSIADLGTIDADPAAGGASARIADKVLILDCLVKNTAGSLSIDSVNTTAATRRDEWFWNVVISGTTDTAIQFKGNIRDVTKELMTLYNDHINGSADKHPAGDLTITTTQTWADGSSHAYGAATTVFAALEGIVNDLNTKDVVDPGAAMIGVGVTSGSSLQTPSYSSPTELADATLQATLETLKNALNGRVFRGGDEGIAGTLAPDTTGRDLGTAAKRWDAYLDNLSVTQAISDINPDGDDTRSLGTASTARWQAALGTSVLEKTLTVQTATGQITIDEASLFLSEGISRIKPTAASKGLELNGQSLPDVGGVSAIGNQSANHLLSMTDVEGNSVLALEAGGRLARPQRFYDDFNYRTFDKTALPNYYVLDLSGATTNSDAQVEDSVVRVQTDGSGLAEAALQAPTLSFDTTYFLWRFFTRVRAGSEGQTDRTDFIGFKSAGAPWRVGFMRDYATFGNHNWHANLFDGSVSIIEDMGVVSTGSFHNLSLWVLDNTDVVFAIDSNAPVKKTANSSMAVTEQFWVEARITGATGVVRTLDVHFWEWFTNRAIVGAEGGDPTSAGWPP